MNQTTHPPTYPVAQRADAGKEPKHGVKAHQMPQMVLIDALHGRVQLRQSFQPGLQRLVMLLAPVHQGVGGRRASSSASFGRGRTGRAVEGRVGGLEIGAFVGPGGGDLRVFLGGLRRGGGWVGGVEVLLLVRVFVLEVVVGILFAVVLVNAGQEKGRDRRAQAQKSPKPKRRHHPNLLGNVRREPIIHHAAQARNREGKTQGKSHLAGMKPRTDKGGLTHHQAFAPQPKDQPAQEHGGHGVDGDAFFGGLGEWVGGWVGGRVGGRRKSIECIHIPPTHLPTYLGR